MTKTVLLIRHAKSSWDSPSAKDFDRPLNERGKRDAQTMAERMIKKSVPIDLFVSSPALRAKKTAEAFAGFFGRSPGEILFLPELYHASPEVFNQVIAAMDDRYNHVAIFSHNPGISEFVNGLGGPRLDSMPTCGVFSVSVASSQWKEFLSAEKKFLFFDYPKA